MDYTPIFNKLTVESFRKFAEIANLTFTRCVKKEHYERQLLGFFSGDPDTEIDFQNFYRETEVAGRKHIFLFKFTFSQELWSKLRHNAESEYISENDRTFDPEADNGNTYYSISDSRLVIKKISIKKTYHFLGESEKGGTLTREFKIILIHFVQFWEFDLKRGRIICGYDSFGDHSLMWRKRMEHELFAFLEGLLEDDYVSIESLITSDHIEKLRQLPNCLVGNLANIASTEDSATYRKAKADFDAILSDLRHEKYKIMEIKEKNPEFDVQTNFLFEAGVASALDQDIVVSNSRADFCYFVKSWGRLNYFRFRIDATKSQFVTNSAAITKQELWDVFGRIV